MDSRSSLSRLRRNTVTKSLTPSLDGSQRHRFMPAMPSPHSIGIKAIGYREVASYFRLLVPNAACLLVMSSLATRRFHWEIVYPTEPRTSICPETVWRMIQKSYRRRVPIETSPVKVKEKSPEIVPQVESEEDLEEEEEDPQEDFEEEGEPMKKRLKEASESDSNTLPPDYTAPNEKTETDLDYTARYEAKPKELESTCESSVRFKPDSPKTIPAYMLPDYPSRCSFF
nr:hypothetical protein [Tanacetum cinerariifolium]